MCQSIKRDESLDEAESPIDILYVVDFLFSDKQTLSLKKISLNDISFFPIKSSTSKAAWTGIPNARTVINTANEKRSADTSSP